MTMTAQRNPDVRQLAVVGNRDLKDPRSPQWAYQAVEYMKTKWRHIDIDHEQFLAIVGEIVRNCAWEVIPDDKPYGDKDALFRAELGASYSEVLGRVSAAEKIAASTRKSMVTAKAADDPVLSGDALSEARAEGGGKGSEYGKEGGRGNKKPLSRRSTKGFSPSQARDSDYTLRRLARIDLDTGSSWIPRYQSGEFKSVKEVARAAGISVRPTITVGNPETVAQAVIRLMGEEYAAALADSLVRLRSDPNDGGT